MTSLEVPPIPARISQATAVEQSRAVAEVQAAVTVAQACPRNTGVAWAEMKLACGRLSLASRAFYAVPNRGHGPSVHLARELARIWGNLDAGVRELRRDDAAHESEIQAYAWDQQTNVRQTRSFIVPHARMKGRDRQALTDLGDIYLNNQNIGARAARECLFAVMPADFVAAAQEICRHTIENGDGKPLHERAANMIAAFAPEHVTVPMIEAKLGRKRGTWTPMDLADLAIVYSSLKRSEVSIEEAFPQAPVTVAEITSPRGRAKPKPAAEGPASPPLADVLALLDELGVESPEAQLAYASEKLGLAVDSLEEMTPGDVDQLAHAVTAWAAKDLPGAGA